MWLQSTHQLNNSSWSTASTGNNWTNWSAAVSLTLPLPTSSTPHSVDGTGNISAINTQSFFYVVKTMVTVRTNGRGNVSPNLNGQMLEIGKSYSMTAAPNSGFGFGGWSGSIASNKTALTFMVQPNLTLTANFVDTQLPTLAITAPTPNLQATNANLTVIGKAADNVAVANVIYQLNNSDWVSPSTTNHWTNWQAGITLVPGTNTIRAYAMDTSGNVSVQCIQTLFYVVPSVMTVQTNGKGSVSPNYNGKLLDVGRSYTMTAIPTAGFGFAGWTGTFSSKTKPR